LISADGAEPDREAQVPELSMTSLLKIVHLGVSSKGWQLDASG